ncbi:MAG: hypothetical protein WC337_07555 [Candidatus Muiribacteriota bacterium]|jgi:hypothetical protein
MKKTISLLLVALFIVSTYGQVYFLPENLNEVMAGNTRSSVRNVPERLNILMNELSDTDREIKDNFDAIGTLIHKQWFVLAEFEKDKNVMLQVFRTMLDNMSNMSDRLHSMELELFNPEALGFDNMHVTLTRVNKSADDAYKALQVGREGLAKSRDSYAKAKSDYARLTEMVNKAIDAIKNAVPYTPAPPVVTPQPEPQPQPSTDYDYSKMNVNIIRQKININKIAPREVVNSASVEGKMVLKKAKEREHQLSTIEKWMYKQAIKNQDGFSYVLIKNGKNNYTVFWWNVIDELEEIF